MSWVAGLRKSDVTMFYDELGVHLPDNGSGEAMVSCFVNPEAHNHDDRMKSCSVNLSTGLWFCHGCGERGNAYQAALKLGKTERPAAQLAQRYRLFLEREPVAAKVPGERQLKAWREQFWASPKIVARLEELRGWSPHAMRRLKLGWDGERVVFPVRNEKGKICGVVRYLPGADRRGERKTLAVGKRNLFPAPERISKDHPLFLVEGEPDAVAVWSLGLRGVAVPGAQSWRHEWAGRLGGRRLLVMCDCDEQGRGLARQLGAWTFGGQKATVVDLDSGKSDGTDIGDWLVEAAGMGQVDVLRRLLCRVAGVDPLLSEPGVLGEDELVAAFLDVFPGSVEEAVA